MSLARITRHLLTPDWWAHRAFPEAVLERITTAVRESEKLHRGELCFVIEGDLDLPALFRGTTPRERAEEIFAQMRIWDTEENSGVLIYVQLIDHSIEIVADRAISAKVAQYEWESICTAMQSAFYAGEFQAGTLKAIAAITELLEQHFPATGDNPDELPNQPARL